MKLGIFIILSSVLLITPTLSRADIHIVGPTNYIVTKGANDPEPVIQAPWGTWTGYIASIGSAQYDKFHELVFEFYTDDYFHPTNSGHWAVAVRADGISDVTGNGHPNLRGSGIIIGNVSGYHSPDPACTPTLFHSTLAIEEFWATGNCVFGAETEGPALENGVRYRIQITSRFIPGLIVLGRKDQLATSYKIWKQNNASWLLLDSVQNYLAASFNPSPKTLSGIFIVEVLSNHTWQVLIDNLTIYTCNNSEAPCSGL